MNIYIWAGFIIAAILYVPLCMKVWRGQVKQSLATWGLWTALDAIAATSVFISGGAWAGIAFYVLGGCLVCFCIVKSKTFTWSRWDSFVTFLVVVCMVVWSVSGLYPAIIASTLAVFIAGTPQIRDSWSNPWQDSVLTWFGFTVVNALWLIGGKEWSVPERFYPLVCTILTASIFLGAVQKYLRTQPVE
jgi:hypothetical protein